jgi:putative phage-type endonuclease
MKVSNQLKQGSKEWLAFRGTGLGASDAPVIMGVSPWTTPFELWCYKTKLLTPPEPHIMAAVAMKRGTDLEPKARELYNAKFNCNSTSINIEHPTHSFIRASLDGLSEDGKVILEIKTPGKADLAEAAKGKVPKKYYWQLMQQLMLVPTATHLDYVTYDGDKTIYITKVERNKEDEEKLLKELIKFWNLVESNVPPMVSSTDIAKLTERVDKDGERFQASINALQVVTKLMAEPVRTVDEDGFVQL